jgi:hypothetical protein
MNDFINNKEIEAFRAILIENENGFEARDTGGKKKTKKLPTPRETELKLAERYGNEWRYNDEEKTWEIYSDKRWEKAEIGAFKTLVKTILDARNIEYSRMAYINNVVKLLQLTLMYPHPADTLPISSGGRLP